MAKVEKQDIKTLETTFSELAAALGLRYSKGLDNTIYVAATALTYYRSIVAQRDALASPFYELKTDKGATKILPHPLLGMASDALRDCITALKALGLTLSKSEAKSDRDAIDLLEA